MTNATETALAVMTNYVSAGMTCYVVTNNPGAAAPYTNWTTAATNIYAAWSNAATLNGSVIILSNGTHQATVVNLALTMPITVRSFERGLSGAAKTILSGPGSGNANRAFVLTHAYAVVEGLTIYRFGSTGSGINNGPIHMYNGLVRDCILTNNYAQQNSACGGVWLDGGTVSNCVILKNNAWSQGAGGGIYANAGNVLNCQITDCYADGGAGGVWAASGVLIRNCLIARNWTAANQSGGGIVGGKVEDCTIAGNTVSGTGNGGGVYNCAYVSNSIVYGNVSATAASSHSGTATFAYSCTMPTNGLSGPGNVQADPLFVNFPAGNYRLRTGSPAIDAGNNGVVTWATDLEGNARIQAITGATAIVDMGAYEYKAALHCDFAASPLYFVAAPITYQCYGPAPFTVQFTAIAGGTNLTGLGYLWDFNGDGVYDQTNATPTASYTYTTPGVYSPRLLVTNAMNEAGGATNANYVSAGSTHYVVTSNPGAASPYTSWTTAASNNIQAAVTEALKLRGSLVIVSNGTYNISAQINVTDAIAIRSFGNGVAGGLTNALSTVVSRGGGQWNFYITAPATVDGFTGTGCGAGAGGNFYVNNSGATVKHCILRNNYGGYTASGIGGYINSGVISNCLIYGNYNMDRMVFGGGLQIDGGTVVACRIYGNNLTNVANQTGGGGVFMNGGTLRNCLLYGNAAGEGGGVTINNGGTVESCTISSNSVIIEGGSSSGRGGGIYRKNGTAGTVLNCIVYGNTAGDTNYVNAYSATTGWTYNDTTSPDVAGTGCINSDPLFVNAAAGNYTLKTTSPCIDKGTNQAWMTGALDLVGNARIQKGPLGMIVDMGAYETLVPPKGTVLMVQ